jgi:hypothetical protein
MTKFRLEEMTMGGFYIGSYEEVLLVDASFLLRNS